MFHFGVLLMWFFVQLLGRTSLSRGEIEMLLFYLVMSDLVWRIPLLRGDKGVCDGEECGLG